MPTVSNTVQISSDGQFVLASGTYKPTLKCFDVQQLAMKFERCFDSEIVNFLTLSDDYSKIVFLHEDRFVEFHNQGGKYYRMRVPRFGRDLCYNRNNCDLIVVGNSSDIYRINLEQGRFLQSYTSTKASGFNACVINDFHQLLAVGSQEGTVECWDHRTRKCVGVVNAAQFVDSNIRYLPEVNSLAYNGALNIAVGTSTGQVMLFDLRGRQPVFTKDHHYEFPIHSIEFTTDTDDRSLVLSSDKKGVKAWQQLDGELITAIEPSDCETNHMKLYPSSGLMFLAAETQKIHAYFVPSLGPAPKWCSFLENLTEEMEEDRVNVVYDDYKFVTKQQLQAVGLEHLIGTSKLRAYMHGYFVNVQLYSRAKEQSEPFAYEEFKQKRIKENIESQRADRVKLEKLPTVNRETAVRLRTEKEKGKAKAKKEADALLTDDRFAPKFFGDPDMQIDLDKEDVEVMNPTILARMVHLQPAIAEANHLIQQEELQRGARSKEWRELDENVTLEEGVVSESESKIGNDSEVEEGEMESTDSERENEVKQLKKLAKMSAKPNQVKFSSQHANVDKSPRAPKSKIVKLTEGEQKRNKKVEMILGTNVAEGDFVVPVRSKLSLKNLNSESAALSDRLAENDVLSKQVDIGLNRSQTTSIHVPNKAKSDKKSRKRGRKG
ncbi:nucleolar protein 10-like isoform X1 [Convolutriloba macropyga]